MWSEPYFRTKTILMETWTSGNKTLLASTIKSTMIVSLMQLLLLCTVFIFNNCSNVRLINLIKSLSLCAKTWKWQLEKSHHQIPLNHIPDLIRTAISQWVLWHSNEFGEPLWALDGHRFFVLWPHFTENGSIATRLNPASLVLHCVFRRDMWRIDSWFLRNNICIIQNFHTFGLWRISTAIQSCWNRLTDKKPLVFTLTHFNWVKPWSYSWHKPIRTTFGAGSCRPALSGLLARIRLIFMHAFPIELRLSQVQDLLALVHLRDPQLLRYRREIIQAVHSFDASISADAMFQFVI